MSEERLKSVLESIKSGTIKDSVTSAELLKTIKLYSENPKYEKYFVANKDKLISHCTSNFDLEDCLSMMFLREIDAFSCEIKDLFRNTVNSIFSNTTLMFVLTIFKLIKSNKLEIDNIYEYVIEELKGMESKKATVILYDLCIFINFRERLYKDYPVIATMISSYFNYNMLVKGSEVFAGSSIIGYLLKEHNENSVRPYVDRLLNGQELNSMNMKMIGGGGSCLVYKINELVLKLGESRENRNIFVNHRILQSYVRDILSRNDSDLMYVEIMNYAHTGDVTEAERDELKADLLRQGIVWSDEKLENCGVLQDGDTNDLYYGDKKPDMLATVVDNPQDREAFARRRRRVVVIDNDYMRMDFAKFGK